MTYVHEWATVRATAPIASRPPRGRLLGASHFAFLRGWIQGLPLGPLAARYLDTGSDLRVARATLRWLRDEVVALAGRSPRPEFAALLRRSPWASQESGTTDPKASSGTEPSAPLAPSLEEFAKRFPDGFYSEVELVELFQTEYPIATAAVSRSRHRRARLIERQLAALGYLEPLLAQPPHLSDRVTAWFSPRIAERLTGAGIGTLGSLRSTFETRGSRWWKEVPRLGVIGAERIERWWREHLETLGPLEHRRRTRAVDLSTIYPGNTVPWSHCCTASERQSNSSDASVDATLGRRPRDSALHVDVEDWVEEPVPRADSATTGAFVGRDIIAPIEYLTVPPQLDGRFGRNRFYGPHAAPPAEDDLAAIRLWLGQRPQGSATWRRYRTESERFLLWAIVERGCAFSDVTSADCIAYRDFLRNPQPHSRWVNQQPVTRWSLGWRPFAGGLSAASVKHAEAVLRALCEWLRRKLYLATNPWRGLSVRATSTAARIGNAARTGADWHAIWRALDDLPETRGSIRLRFVFRFLRETGLSRADLCSLKVRNLAWSEELGCWAISLRRGQKPLREVPLSTSALRLVVGYLAGIWRGHEVATTTAVERWLERLPGNAPLLVRAGGMLEGQVAVAPSSIYKSARAFLATVALPGCEPTDQDCMEPRVVSGKWLSATCPRPTAQEFSPRDIELQALVR